jgi:hypothetical protein
MAFEDTPGTADEQPADDIRSALAAAFATSETDAAETPAKPAAKPKAAESDAGPDGGDAEFEAESEAAPKEKPAPKAKGAEAEPDAVDADPDKAAAAKSDADKAEAAVTGKWSAKDKEILKTLPPEGRELILRRHKEMEGAFTKKTQESAAFRKEYEPVDKIFEPYRDQMRQSGYTPQTLIQAWANVEDRLMKGDGVAVVAGLINGYKIDLGRVAQALGIRPRSAAAAANPSTNAQDQNGTGQPDPATGGNQIQLPPEIMQTLQTLATRQTEFERRIAAEDRQRADSARAAQQSAVQRIETELETFKSAQDDKGNPLHPHFEELETEMALLAKAAIEARLPVPPLKELYEKAAWANPSTRDAMHAARDRAQQEKAAAEARAKAAKARKAGSSVNGAPGPGQAQQGRQVERTLREELDAAAEDLGA